MITGVEEDGPADIVPWPTAEEAPPYLQDAREPKVSDYRAWGPSSHPHSHPHHQYKRQLRRLAPDTLARSLQSAGQSGWNHAQMHPSQLSRTPQACKGMGGS